MVSIIFPSVQHGHHRPVEKPWSFGAMAHREPLPILGLKRTRLGLLHRHAFATLRRLYPHRLIAGHCQPVEVLMRFQKGSQCSVATVDGISHHPGKRNSCLPKALDHLLSLFAFGCKRNLLGNACLLTALPIGDPTQRKVEFAIEERVPPAAHVGQKYPDLTVFELTCGATMLFADPSRFFASLAKACLINHDNRLWITQAFQN